MHFLYDIKVSRKLPSIALFFGELTVYVICEYFQEVVSPNHS